jgi:proline dehydrogenase
MLNKLIITLMPYVPKPIIKSVAIKYIAGPELSDAVKTTKIIESHGGMTTIDCLGEFVSEKDRAMQEKVESLTILDAIKENNLPTYLSIKPTSLGLGIDVDFGFENIKEIVTKAEGLGIFVRLDMENSPYTTKTLDIYKKLRNLGLDNVGVVIQAYMRRSEDDIRSLSEYKPSIRLCKGIYNEDKSIAFKDKEEIRNNYKKLLRLIFDLDMYPGIATHDEPLILDAMQLIKERSIPRDKYEFQMLLGVREQRRQEIIDAGHRMRIYVPFGKDWYGYSTRRLKENPDMAGIIFKAIFFKK